MTSPRSWHWRGRTLVSTVRVDPVKERKERAPNVLTEGDRYCHPCCERVTAQSTQTMSLHISSSVSDALPSSVKQGLAKLSPEVQATFEEEFKRQSKSSTLMLVLAIFFPIQHFLLGRMGIGIAFLVTGGGLGFWWIIEWFMAFPRTRTYNGDLAKSLLRDIKIMQS